MTRPTRMMVFLCCATLLIPDNSAFKYFPRERFKRQDIIFPEEEYYSDTCTLREGGEGTCQALSSCSITGHINPTLCEFREGEPYVCCPQRPHSQQLTQCGRPNVPPPPVTPPTIILAAVGGFDAFLNARPWMVALGKNTGSRPNWFCGGALIDNRHVLTAAHCLISKPTIARLGDLDLNDNVFDGASPVNITIERTLPHPKFKYPSLYYDIALIRLSEPVSYSESMLPVCLPSKQLGNLDGKEVVLTGWGQKQLFGETSDKLQEVEMQVVKQAECYDRYLNVPEVRLNLPSSILDHQICAGVPGGGKDACQGDSGGPLVYRETSSGQWHILGVVSGGLGCGFEKFPGVYTRVDHFLNWILQNTKD